MFVHNDPHAPERSKSVGFKRSLTEGASLLTKACSNGEAKACEWLMTFRAKKTLTVENDNPEVTTVSFEKMSHGCKQNEGFYCAELGMYLLKERKENLGHAYFAKGILQLIEECASGGVYSKSCKLLSNQAQTCISESYVCKALKLEASSNSMPFSPPYVINRTTRVRNAAIVDIKEISQGNTDKIISRTDSKQISKSIAGSGILFCEAGYIATNFHVVERAENIKVIFSGIDQKFSATIKIKDARNDLAILKIDNWEKSPVFGTFSNPLKNSYH